MAKKTLLTMVQNACDEIGITSPASVISNSDPQIKQILALANREGNEVYDYGTRTGGWSILRNEYKFTTAAITGLTGTTTLGSNIITGISSTTGIVAGTWCVSGNGIPYPARITAVGANQVTVDVNATLSASGVALSFGQDAYALPSDFGFFINQTFWDRNYRWQLLGPLQAQEWQVLKSGISPTGPRRRFRIMNNMFYMDPVPSDSTSIEAYEYYRNTWCVDTIGATFRQAWGADTDTYLMDDELMIMGLKWRFLRAKGLDYDEEFTQWKLKLERSTGRDAGERSLPLNQTSENNIHLLSSANVPDTGYGS